MVSLDKIEVDGHIVTGVTVELPKTRLVALVAGGGYLMCGALDVNLLNDLLKERQVVAARCLGVRSYEDLLKQPVDLATEAAEKIGVTRGMAGKDALLAMLEG